MRDGAEVPRLRLHSIRNRVASTPQLNQSIVNKSIRMHRKCLNMARIIEDLSILKCILFWFVVLGKFLLLIFIFLLRRVYLSYHSIKIDDAFGRRIKQRSLQSIPLRMLKKAASFIEKQKVNPLSHQFDRNC